MKAVHHGIKLLPQVHFFKVFINIVRAGYCAGGNIKRNTAAALRYNGWRARYVAHSLSGFPILVMAHFFGKGYVEILYIKTRVNMLHLVNHFINTGKAHIVPGVGFRPHPGTFIKSIPVHLQTAVKNKDVKYKAPNANIPVQARCAGTPVAPFNRGLKQQGFKKIFTVNDDARYNVCKQQQARYGHY